MKNIYIYRSLFLLLLILFIAESKSNAQGCVAIRSFSGCGGGVNSSAILMPGESLVGTNFRYFQSFRHFRGTHEEKERIEQGTQVINDSYFLDTYFNYSFAERWFGSVTIPMVYHERSSMYEHGGNSLGDRHKTYSQGLSDIRIGASYWMLSPEESPKKNFSLGLGLKLPTGDFKAKGTFYNAGENGEPERRYVDQSIQPGDGGYGLTTELQGFAVLGDYFAFNAYLFYLINPMETNGVKRRPNRDTEFSVPDQYAVRLGFNYMSPVHGLDFYLGGRLEGIPAFDLVGGSDGYRRPGYAISVEPGVNYSVKNFLFNVSVPLAVERNRTQSFLDKQRENETGIPRHGDAAFADYLINVGVSFKFMSKKNHQEVSPEFKGIN